MPALRLNILRWWPWRVSLSVSIGANRPPLRRASRLFLYGLHAGPDGRGRSAAAIGLLSSNDLAFAHVYRPGTFALWNGVYSATRAGIRWLLFLNPDGRAATGTINSDFEFVQAKAYPVGKHPNWMEVAVDGNGELLLTSALAGGRTRVGFGQVDPDGTLIVWWQSEVALAHPERLLGLPHAHAWLTTKAGPQPTSTVSLLRRGAVVGSRTWNESWTGMAAHGELLAVYRGVQQFPIPGGTQTTPPHYEVCRVGPDHQITTVWSYEDFPGKVDNTIGADIDTPTGTLFYQFAVGSNVAEVRSLTELGLVSTAALGNLRQIVPDLPDTGMGWYQIAPC
jgi:hypothetical protein